MALPAFAAMDNVDDTCSLPSQFIIDGNNNTSDGGDATQFFETFTGANVTLLRMIRTGEEVEDAGAIVSMIDGPGTDALVADGSAPAAVGSAPVVQQAQQGQSQVLSGCMVRTRFNLNFRQSPAGNPLSFTDPWGNLNSGWLPADVTLTALERRDGWFRVDYHGTQGWISAGHVEPQGACG